MTPPVSRMAALALSGLLFVWPLLDGCAHSHKTANAKGGAPGLLHEEDAPRRGGTNPNAPYMVAASKPQLVTRPQTTEPAVDLPVCNSDNLEVSEISAAMNGAYRGVKLAFNNQGVAPCKLGGYPSIRLEDDKGDPVANLVVDKATIDTLSAELAQEVQPAALSQSGAQITLVPKGQAWFQVAWKTGEGCPVISRIRISAPDSEKSFVVDRPLTVCEGRVQITTLHADPAE